MLSGALSKESKDMSMQVKEANIKLIIPLLREKEKALGVVKKTILNIFKKKKSSDQLCKTKGPKEHVENFKGMMTEFFPWLRQKLSHN